MNTNSRLSWDEYFMNIAILASLRSKDTTKVGCVITNKYNQLIGMGYNGLPHGIDESKFPTSNSKSLPIHETKYAYVVHAELNAISNSTVHDLSGSKVYVTLYPCCHCAAMLINRGIKEIVYLSDKHHNDSEYVASRKLLCEAGVEVTQYSSKLLFEVKD